MVTTAARLILASTSPYRSALLDRLGLPFTVQAPGIDEAGEAHEKPASLAWRLAVAKARAVSLQHPEALVIGSDQVATLDGVGVIGKPGNHAGALAQLRAASGNTMQFHTALCATRRYDSFEETGLVMTRVRFRRLDEAEIERYLRLEQPYDCAGSAKVEGLGIALLESIEGDDPTALIGLPLIALSGMLRHAGLPPLCGA